MNILKVKKGYIGNSRLIYCGRPKENVYFQGELLIGLGNPASWKNTDKAKFKVKDLAESLTVYRQWLWKIIKAGITQQINYLKGWEIKYWEEVLKLAIAIKKNEVDGLMCFCVEIKNYTPVKGQEVCHTQILYAACLYLIQVYLPQ